jgi:hypothetical protein
LCPWNFLQVTVSETGFINNIVHKEDVKQKNFDESPQPLITASIT